MISYCKIKCYWSFIDQFITFISVSPCDPNPCQNGATCLLSDDPANPTCVCAEGFEGLRCEIPSMF